MLSFKIKIAAFMVVAFSGIALAQTWFPFPVVGGRSFCISTVNNVCTTTVPAGPALTGNETIPADTNIASGVPTSVKLSQQNLGIGPYTYNAPLTGATINVASTSRRLMLNPAGTIATLLIQMPGASVLVDNQHFGICTTQIVSAVTLNPGQGTNMNGIVTALSVPSTTGAANCPEWVYRQANTTWYRIH